MPHVRSADGTHIGFDWLGNDGPAVVLVGGGLDDGTENVALGEHLARDFAVVNYRRRGRGDSGDVQPYAVQREIEDLAAVIGAAGGRAHVFGASSGGALAGLGLDLRADAHREQAPIAGLSVGAVDREHAAERVVALLGSGARGRSTWNAYDVRGVSEEVLSKLDVIGDRSAYDELVEDVASRAKRGCVSVVDRGVPVHVRHLTSPAVPASRCPPR